MPQTLEEKVLRTIETRNLLAAGDKVLAAVSGGADSTALLFLLHSLKERLGVQVAAAHFNHGIRGKSAQDDQAFVASLCASLEIECICGHGDVPALSRTRHLSMEDAARQARYAFLQEAALGCGANKIALAHQMEDQAETLLLHLLHGCGLEGLGGMRYQTENRIRPLLSCHRREIEEYLLSMGQTWREDETNQDCAFVRNKIRRQMAPLMESINPRYAEALFRTAEQAARAADVLNDQARRVLKENAWHSSFGAVLENGAEQSPFRREAVRLLAKEAGVCELSMEQTLRLESLAAGEEMNLPGGWKAQKTQRALYLLKNETMEEPKPEQLRRLPGENTLGDGKFLQAFPETVLQGALLRLPRKGDKFRPFGGRGEQKLTEALRDAGIDRPLRPYVPVLAKESQVLWIIGTGKIACEAVIREAEGERCLLRFEGRLPWQKPETYTETK